MRVVNSEMKVSCYENKRAYFIMQHRESSRIRNVGVTSMILTSAKKTKMHQIIVKREILYQYKNVRRINSYISL